MTKSFGGVTAAKDVSFDVRAGSITAVIGPNGAGKTTLFNLITNVIAADSGDVVFEGQLITKRAPAEIASLGLIRTFQTARVFPGLTVLENILVGRHRLLKYGIWSQISYRRMANLEERRLVADADRLLDVIGLTSSRDMHAISLPMGAQKLLEVVRAVMAGPALLLLDEPAAGLNDTETEELSVLLSAIRAMGVTILLVEHNMGLVMSISDHVVVIEAGGVLTSGSPYAVRNDDRVIAAYLGRGSIK